MHFKQILDLIKKSVTAWVDDYAPSMGAAISYYEIRSRNRDRARWCQAIQPA